MSVITALILPGTTAFSQTLALDELTAKIQTAYDHTVDFKANFIQEATIKSIDRTEKEEGTVYLKKPERMLWNYTKPSMKKLVINPRKAWLYMPDDNIVYVQDAKNVLSSKMTIRFLTGIGNLKDDFETAFSAGGPTDTEGNYVIILTPREYEAGIKTLLLTVDKDNFRIIECVFTDMYENTTRLSFSDIRFNINPPDELFEFTPPSGVEVHNIQGQ
ncbi:MAG: outer membrane lipoprotein carrier protein LolA [Syntrophobacterales bacterium]|nr:outer membrane lipoprotein carrier protein LolA [Syntrophobacterales bacterium]